MNLVRWFRKYNKRVMAIVVIVIMFGFIGGGTLLEQLGRRRKEAIAYITENTRITNYDLYLARRELDILRLLRIDELLRSQDLQGILLGELIFSDQRASPALINRLKQVIRTNQFGISDKQINDMYRRQAPPSIYWYCLQNEAQRAGITIPNSQVGELLGKVIPQLFSGQTYSQLMGAIISQQRIPEEQILATLGKLLAVLQYAQMICSNEDVTTRQIMHVVGAEEERVDVELVKFDSAVFAEIKRNADAGPGEEKMMEHFEKYKKFYAGTINNENPYGFGYKLPDRVQLEYIAIKLADVRSIVKSPTQDELGDYYERHKADLFTEQVRTDPNDPNSPLVERLKSYAEVAGTISQQLLKDKINTTANRILQDAKRLIEADLEKAGIESESLTAEQLKEKAGNYQTAAEQLSEKYKIKVYAGRTGLLSPIDIQTDEHLSTLYLQGFGQNPVRLSRVVFAVDELAVSELGPFDVPKPRIYENIGPVRDLLSELRDVSGAIMAMIRVIDAQKASEPESINQSFSTSSLTFDQDPNQAKADEDSFSVKEKVAEDLKRLTAMDTTKSKAEEFVDLVTKDNWENALKKFDELYRQQEKQDQNEPSIFRLQNLADLRRISKATLETLAVQNQGNPAAPFLLNDSKINQQFIEQLYSLVPQDSNTVEALPLVMEFKPNMSYYVIKNISVKRLWKEEYEKIKTMRLFREDYIQSQNLAAVHFNPENILKRMKFKAVEADQAPAQANTPVESEESEEAL